MCFTQAHQYACADYAKCSVRADRARLRLRHFTEGILFTFVPALAVQFAYLVVAVMTRIRLTPGVPLALAEEYLRFLNMLFSINFGLLAVWWSSRRIDALAGAQTESKQPMLQDKSYVEAIRREKEQDKSLIDWLLGPIEPEHKLAVDGKSATSTSGQATSASKQTSSEEEEILQEDCVE